LNYNYASRCAHKQRRARHQQNAEPLADVVALFGEACGDSPRLELCSVEDWECGDSLLLEVDPTFQSIEREQ
jgi:hypothetical protein